MPKKDTFHDKVVNSLRKDGWIITNDPLFVPTEGGVNFFIDLGLERIIGAEKNGQNIAVEIKSFDENTPVYSFYEILGQFLIYEMALAEQVSPWELYIAIADLGFKKLDEAPIFNKAIQQFRLKFISLIHSQRRLNNGKDKKISKNNLAGIGSLCQYQIPLYAGSGKSDYCGHQKSPLSVSENGLV